MKLADLISPKDFVDEIFASGEGLTDTEIHNECREEVEPFFEEIESRLRSGTHQSHPFLARPILLAELMSTLQVVEICLARRDGRLVLASGDTQSVLDDDFIET